MNKVIVDELKKRLEESKGRWTEELPNVLWPHRTNSTMSKSETPHSLTNVAEAIILVEIAYAVHGFRIFHRPIMQA